MALKSLSAMFTIIKTFLDHQRAEATMPGGNIKEAAPLLWKTPLNLFFHSRDLGPHVKEVTDCWEYLVEGIFRKYLSEDIQHPKEKISVQKWLFSLPDRDLVAEADEEWDNSFGGLGTLEGGATSAEEAKAGDGSMGHPYYRVSEYSSDSPKSVGIL
jgi:hypothetical protein